jgi:hypothetical protein
MKTISELEFYKILKQITDLYGDTTLAELYNDLVAIGTVPTPDIPSPSFIVGKNVVAIGTVPVPDIRKKLKKTIKKLLEISRESTIKELLN